LLLLASAMFLCGFVASFLRVLFYFFIIIFCKSFFLFEKVPFRLGLPTDKLRATHLCRRKYSLFVRKWALYRTRGNLICRPKHNSVKR
jgi:hypothetical protein